MQPIFRLASPTFRLSRPFCPKARTPAKRSESKHGRVSIFGDSPFRFRP